MALSYLPPPPPPLSLPTSPPPRWVPPPIVALSLSCASKLALHVAAQALLLGWALGAFWAADLGGLAAAEQSAAAASVRRHLRAFVALRCLSLTMGALQLRDGYPPLSAPGRTGGGRHTPFFYRRADWGHYAAFHVFYASEWTGCCGWMDGRRQGVARGLLCATCRPVRSRPSGPGRALHVAGRAGSRISAAGGCTCMCIDMLARQAVDLRRKGLEPRPGWEAQPSAPLFNTTGLAHMSLCPCPVAPSNPNPIHPQSTPRSPIPV